MRVFIYIAQIIRIFTFLEGKKYENFGYDETVGYKFWPGLDL